MKFTLVPSYIKNSFHYIQAFFVIILIVITLFSIVVLGNATVSLLILIQNSWHRLLALYYFITGECMSMLGVRSAGHSKHKKIGSSIELVFHNCGLRRQSHKVTTSDGFILTLHQWSMVQDTDCIDMQNKKPAVLLVHGLLQDSDSFVCGGTSSLVYSLAKAGNNVWTGNNRGTKYSFEHSNFPSTSSNFWNFNIDDLGKYDVPAMINHVIKQTGQTKINLIGFSQGSAQIFIALSHNSILCEKVSLFIALAPAVKTAPVDGVINHIAHTYPNLISKIFGKLSMLSQVHGWKRLLSPEAFEKVCSYSMQLLFGWSCSEMSLKRRIELYQHIFSSSSVQCVEHWFHIMRNGGLLCTYGTRDVVQYDIGRISCPIAVLSGGRDYLVDASIIPLLSNTCFYTHNQNQYEHLDLIWADSAEQHIFTRVISLIRNKST